MELLHTFAARIEQQIEARYLERRERLGWRLLSSPLSTIDTAEIAFIGINPGGSTADPEHDGLSVEAGSAYRIESWSGFSPGFAPLQRQVLEFFELLGVEPDDVLSGNLIPFRSPRAIALAGYKEAARFGTEIWRQILARSQARLLVCMGNDVTRLISALVNVDSCKAMNSGWGNVSLKIGENEQYKILGLPHLSTFKLMSRSNCVDILRNIIGNTDTSRAV
ncbi:MAG: hypothetical protein R3D34_15650 [Nitratireductor sp.]